MMNKPTNALRICGRIVMLCVAGLFFAGCSFEKGPRIKVIWTKTQPSLVAGVPVRFTGTGVSGQITVDVGKVTRVEPHGEGVIGDIRLYAKHAHYIRVSSAFVFHKPDGSNVACIEVRTDALTDPGVQDGAVFKASETLLDKLTPFIVNWKRTGTLVLAGVALVLCGLLLVRFLFKLGVLLVCVAGGVCCAYQFDSWFQSQALPYLPEGVPPHVAGVFLAFLCGYLLSAVVLVILRTPLGLSRK